MGLTALKPLIGLQASKQHEELLDVLSARSCRDQQPWFESRDKKKKKEKVRSQSGCTLNCLTAFHYDFTDAAGLNFWRWRVKYYSPSRNWRETKRTSSRYCLLSKFSCSPFISLWAIHNWLFTSMLVKVAVFRLFFSPRIIVNKVWYIQKAFQWSVISNTYSSVKFLY